jgi:glucose/arabinose dehydrogenase
LAFGPDGMLYMGLGDGGNAGDPQGFAQNLQSLLGKILRLDVSSGQDYAIPAGNPFANGGGLPEIWALGLRNPWRFTFDRQTGDLYIGDVGQKGWEEIDFLPAGSSGGANLGWNFREGAHPYQGEPPASLTFLEPIAEYSHTLGCSVTGGVVVRSLNLPEWQGVYLYGDYCTGRVWGLLQTAPGIWLNAELFKTDFNISSFGEDDDGGIYLLDHSGGSIYRLAKK